MIVLSTSCPSVWISMAFDWIAYLWLAKELVGQATIPSGEEAKLRAAISRAYYAAFHSARMYMRRQGAPTPAVRTYTAHEAVIHWFEDQPQRQYKAVGARLRRLKDERVAADYERNIGADLTAITVRARNALYEAERIIAMVDAL